MSNETYIGHRYVPQVEGEWSNNKAYEELSIVLYEGNSYTSKQKVPEGVDIKNETFWVLSGNYNAQMEQLKKEFDNAVGAFTVDSEVVLARGDNSTLGSRLNIIESEKANKKQGEWITPTLMNGWEKLDLSNTVKYFKDDFGFVHLRGIVKSGVDSTVVLSLPIGYRPPERVYFGLTTEDLTPAQCNISNTSGNLTITKARSLWFSLEGISFKAVN